MQLTHVIEEISGSSRFSHEYDKHHEERHQTGERARFVLSKKRTCLTARKKLRTEAERVQRFEGLTEKKIGMERKNMLLRLRNVEMDMVREEDEGKVLMAEMDAQQEKLA